MTARQKYALQDLLQVRRLREDAAAKQWARQKQKVADVEDELARCRQELADYQAWRVHRENEMFREIMNQTVQPKDLDALRFRVQKLRDEESNYQSRVIETENRLRAEQEKLEEDRQAYFKAYRNRDKLDEHKSLWLCAADRAYEAAEEKESEDFKNRMGCLAAEGA